ncbi:hypothetical protein J2W97_000633 [Paenibacillus jamilae]|nr:hypothetical protein [Paenibacillus jamilae]
MIDKVLTGIYEHLHYKYFIVIIQQKKWVLIPC